MIQSLADKLKSAGYSSNSICQYDIFTLDDKVIVFPEERLGQSRTMHDKRLVIILQNDRDNNDPTIKICTIAPLSTSKEFFRLDYLIKKNPLHTFLKDDSYIRIGHIQPILKVDLKKKIGSVVDQKIKDDIQDRLFILVNN